MYIHIQHPFSPSCLAHLLSGPNSLLFSLNGLPPKCFCQVQELRSCEWAKLQLVPRLQRLDLKYLHMRVNLRSQSNAKRTDRSSRGACPGNPSIERRLFEALLLVKKHFWEVLPSWLIPANYHPKRQKKHVARMYPSVKHLELGVLGAKRHHPDTKSPKETTQLTGFLCSPADS